MALLRKRYGKARRLRGKLRPYTVLRCPMVGHQAGWCRGLCEPIGPFGLCGREAPHLMKDRTQRAIAAYATRKSSCGEDPGRS